MNAYELKQEERRERYEERAEKLRKESDEAFSQARSMSECIPFGQPILVGHHSEKRDRNFRAKIGNKYEKSFKLNEKADYYEQKAASVGTAGISSDDPEAIAKLKEKLAKLEKERDLYKLINKAHTAYLKDPEKLDKFDLQENTKQMIRDYVPEYSWTPHPIAPYQFQNLSANIRQVKQRIERLEKEAKRETKEHEFDGFTVREDTEDNRIWFLFDGKPDEATRKVLKSHGFKWSPKRPGKPWVRMLNNAGIYSAKQVIRELKAGA